MAAMLSVGESDPSASAASPSNAFARPKSSTLTAPSGVTLILAGFRSRWMIPFSCAASSASAICRAMESASSSCDGTMADAIRERRSFGQLHDERAHAFGFFQSVNGGDVRVIERGEQLRLSLEAPHALGIARKLGGQDFQRDVPVELRVMRAIHLAHPAHTQQR